MQTSTQGKLIMLQIFIKLQRDKEEEGNIMSIRAFLYRDHACRIEISTLERIKKMCAQRCSRFDFSVRSSQVGDPLALAVAVAQELDDAVRVRVGVARGDIGDYALVNHLERD